MQHAFVKSAGAASSSREPGQPEQPSKTTCG